MRKILALTAGAVMVAGSAMAVPILTLDDGNTSVSVTDGGIGDISLLAGVVAYSGDIGTWIVNVTTGLSYPVLGVIGAPNMDLNSVNVSGGTGSLTITLADTFTDPLSSGLTGFSLAAGGTTNGSVSISSYFDGVLLSDLGTFSGGAFAGTDAASAIPSGTPYSLSIVAEITHGTGTNTTSFDAELSTVPEPTTMLLLGSGLLGLAGVSRRKSRKS